MPLPEPLFRRACVEGLFEFGVASSGGKYAPAPLDVEVDVPASTLPAIDAAGG